jgi:hypothetical protein
MLVIHLWDFKAKFDEKPFELRKKRLTAACRQMVKKAFDF